MKNKLKPLIAIVIALVLVTLIVIFVKDRYEGYNLVLTVGDIKEKSGMTAEDFEDPDTWLEKDKSNIIKAINSIEDVNVSDVEMMSFESTDDYVILQVMADNYGVYNLKYDKVRKKYTLTLE